MSKYTTADIRNIALLGTGGAGKTTFVEAMLNKAGCIGRAGKVEDGNTVCDHDELEKVFGGSLDSALVHFDHADAHLNVIDTPGRPDFLGKSLSVLPAVETAVIMLDASVGIDPVVRRAMKVAAERKLPRLILINKIDHATGLDELLANIQEAFGSACRPINLPAGGGASVVDCFNVAEGSSDLGDVADFHTGIVDQIVEVDEALMEQYLESGSVTAEQLQAPFRRALREAHLVPVCFAAGRDDIGVTEFMDVVATLCPNPTEGNPRPFECTVGGETKSIEAEPKPDKPVIAHVFKVASDPYVGKLCVFRVHQGHLGADVQPHVNDGRKAVRIAHVFKLQGKEHAEVPQITAGDIGAVAKVEEIDYDATLHSGEADGLHLRPLPLPKPMYGMAIEGTSKGAENKLGDALRKMTAEDPTLAIERVQATGETVLRGLGEQHLRVKLRMLKDRYGIEVDTRPPKVAYKETITGKAEGHHRHKKQTGGAGQFGEVFLRVEPISGDEEGIVDGLLFSDDTFGGSIPKQFMPAVEKGVRRVMADGAVAGYPLQNIKVSVYDGKHHPVDSKEVAFITAGKKAFVDAIQKARPALLEPFVRMEITVPADMIGDISSDLSGRRGRIQGTDMLPGNQAVVIAEAPLAEVMSYSNQLKSITGGAGSYAMEYSHDEKTPPNIQAEVVAAFKPKDEED
ncbi:MAG: elongation factor G [Phycisphaerales bacterium]|nr:elongation factor G [Phycisphaerae bacterium]NNF43355.1 elongation factor G [Phycisphaerales bacterium]NNM27545.1 elongation factor G [Phycisphaerales bacterium]